METYDGMVDASDSEYNSLERFLGSSNLAVAFRLCRPLNVAKFIYVVLPGSDGEDLFRFYHETKNQRICHTELAQSAEPLPRLDHGSVRLPRKR